MHDLPSSHAGFQIRPERFAALLDRIVAGRSPCGVRIDTGGGTNTPTG